MDKRISLLPRGSRSNEDARDKATRGGHHEMMVMTVNANASSFVTKEVCVCFPIRDPIHQRGDRHL